MQSRSLFVIGPVALVLPLACSGNPPESATGAMDNGPGSGGVTASGGSAASGGAPLEQGGTETGGGGTGSGGISGGGSGGSGDANASGGLDISAGAMGAVGGAAAGQSGDDLLFVPEDLPVTNLSGEGKAVNVIAFTLFAGPQGPELYAALRNDGEITACTGSVSFELFDKAEQSVGSWVGGLYGDQLFRRSDGSGGLVACLEPGGVAMAGLTDLPESLAIDELGAAVYQLTYFDRDILPFELVVVDSLTVTGIQTVSTDSGNAFLGTFENGLDVPVTDATVTIFPLNRVGRPLGMAVSNSTADVPPGGSWPFETTVVENPGVDYVAYPSGSVSF